MKMLSSLILLGTSLSFSSIMASEKIMIRTKEESSTWTLIKKRFYQAAQQGNTIYARELLEKLLLSEEVSQLINHQDSDPLETSPLMAAAMGGHVEMCKLLIELGAVTTLANIGKHTALELARIHGQESVCMLFKALRDSQETQFSRYVRYACVAAIPLGLVALVLYFWGPSSSDK